MPRGDNFWVGPDTTYAVDYNKSFEAIVQTFERQSALNKITAEIDRAYAKHGQAKWSRHEFYGIMLEEVDEVWDDIKTDAPWEQLEKEIVQVAAMCVRFLESGDPFKNPKIYKKD